MANITRRQLLYQASLAAPILLAGNAVFGAEGKQGEATLLEHLAHQHGIVVSALLIYVHGADQLQKKKDFDMQVLSETRELARDYIENFHERVAEEQYIFPPLEKAKKMPEVMHEMMVQHAVSRQLTDLIGTAIKNKSVDDLITYIPKFVTMYLAHAAWEGGIVFPAMRPLVGDKEYAELGAKLAAEQEKLYGKEGLIAVANKVGELQRKVGIGDPAVFTAKV